MRHAKADSLSISSKTMAAELSDTRVANSLGNMKTAQSWCALYICTHPQRFVSTGSIYPLLPLFQSFTQCFHQLQSNSAHATLRSTFTSAAHPSRAAASNIAAGLHPLDTMHTYFYCTLRSFHTPVDNPVSGRATADT